MSQTVIGLSREADKEVWQEAEKAVAETLDVEPDELSRTEVCRELAEAYTGKQPLGRWRE